MNYDWNIERSDQLNVGMNYTEFHEWAKKNSISLYPVLDITKVGRDKYKTYLLIRQYKENMQPLSEVFKNPDNQIGGFFEENNLILLKPRFGNHGVGIMFVEKGVNKRGNPYYFFDHYKGG